MSAIKLYYFDLHGRAEGARLLLAAAGAKYDDIRFSAASFAGPQCAGNTTQTWADYKAKAPYGQAPVLEVDGVPIAQSKAIERFVARHFGLFGSTVLEGALIDATLEQLRDLGDAFHKINHSVPKDEQAAAKTKFLNELGDKTASLAKQLEHSKGFFVGDRLSAADVLFFHYFNDHLRAADAAAFDAHLPASLKAHLAKVGAVPAIQAYLAARPPRPF